MDGLTHTLIATGLLAISYYSGIHFNRQKIIQETVDYLLQYGALTEDDIQRANERYDEETNSD